MEMREFAQKVTENISTKVVGEVTTSNVTKNNGLTLTGLIIREKDNPVAPTIYLDKYLNDFNEGADMENIINQIMETYEEHKGGIQYDAESFTDWDKVKDTIIFKLINKERNADFLKEAPHVLLCDMALIFQSLISTNEDEDLATITILNSHKDLWGKSTDDLFDMAKVNTPKLLPAKVQSMNDVMRDMMAKDGIPEELLSEMIPEMPEDKMMYVISNKDNINGAAAILYKDCEPLKELAEKVGTDLYILPSSIHEVIAISAKEVDPAELKAMIGEVNTEQVRPEERLGDNPYLYKKDTNELSVA